MRKDSINYGEDCNHGSEVVDFDAVVTYLEMINDFIKSNIQEEMNEYQ